MIDAERIGSLASYQILDTPPEATYDNLAQLTADVCDTPVAFIGLIDGDRQWFKARVDFEPAELPSSGAFCAHTILHDGPLVVPDAAGDPRFSDSPLVTGPLALRFFAGVSIRAANGLPVGTLCVHDTKPRPGGLTDRQLRSLATISEQVGSALALRRTLRTLGEAMERTRLAQETVGVGTWHLDFATNLNILSPKSQAMFGLEVSSRDRAVPVSDLIALLEPDDVEGVNAALKRAFDGGPYDVTFRVRPPDGSIRYIQGLGRAEMDQDGRPGRIVGLNIDVTERKRSETELQRAQDDLLRMSRLSAMGAMASTLAHELNQPLTAVTQYLDGVRLIASRGAVDPQLHDWAEKAGTEARRAGDIIRRIRRFTMEGRIMTKPESLADILERAVTAVTLQPGAGDVKIACEIAPEAQLVQVDPIQVEQVLTNLLRNAIDAMALSPERRITIAARREGEMVEVALTDTGPGLSPEIYDNIFHPFGTSKSEGLGLGLPLCRTIVEAHGGRIWAEPPKPGGATIMLTLRAGERPPREATPGPGVNFQI